MRRILHYVAGSMNRGGLENNLMNVYRNIDRNKYQFDFIVHSKHSYYENEIKKLGGKIYCIPFKSKNYKKALNGFRQVLEKKEYDIIHFHISYANVYQEAKMARRLGKKIIIHAHASAGETPKKKITNALFKGKLDKTVDMRLAVSEAAAKWQFTKDTLINNNYQIVGNSINLDQFGYSKKVREAKRAQLHCSDNFVIGTTGRLVKSKNIQFLIKLVKKIRNIIPNVKLIIVGSGPYEERLKKLSRSIKNKVIFIEETEGVNDYLNAFDVFCFPTRHEGLGLSAIEAQCSGLPCIINKKLPAELNATDLVYRVRLSQKLWSSSILDIHKKNPQRKDMAKKIKEASFNTKKNASILMDIYDQINKEVTERQ